ncbi:MAG: diguanylate cyclase [Pirellulales bacterium]|nr:diguanylate cyclase [Pirellulales bacterium]
MNLPAKKRALVVEDDPACSRLLERLLVRQGYDVTTAADGLEALDVVFELQPSLILTDWVMPRMDGLELIRALRAAELGWYPYVILVTAQPDPVAGLEVGADDFLGKPIEVRQLVPRIQAAERIIQLQESLREKNERLNVANERLSKLVVADPLTGLLNRRAFFEQATREWQRSQRYDLPLSCLMLDIDHFKRINDTYGHPTGDLVIKALADALRDRFRESDLLCRYGGEEFCVLLANTDAEGAAQLAERVRDLVAQLRLPGGNDQFCFTISCGLSARTLEVLNEETLIDFADQALLIAKRSGRNRVIRHDDLAHSSSLVASAAADAPEDDGRDDGATIPYLVVNTLLTALKHRDEPTAVHSRRVAQWCRDFARYMGLEPKQRIRLEIAALLHDIGRLAIPDQILNKTGALTDEEFAIAQRHRQVTVDILNSCFSNKKLVDTVRLSDRWYDGTHGDPAGQLIPLGARVLAIASLFDDVHFGRGWWRPHTVEEAVDVLDRAAGTQLDPELVRQFGHMLFAQSPMSC